jgi:hypothetical protein
MSNVATASINTFGIASPKADFVSPSEEQIFVLTSGQLQEIIARAIQPLQDEISQLRATVDRQGEKIATLEATEEQDISRLALDIALDRQRLVKLEQRPTPAPIPAKGEKTTARITKIDEILKSRGPTTLTQIEHILQISPKEMNRLLAKLDMRRFELHARPGDGREKVLRLKVQIR